MNGKRTTTMPKLAQIMKEEHAIMELCVGPDQRGPVKCIRCHEPFKPGESWRRMTSPPDPVYGAYAIGVHKKCAEQESIPRAA
jgi:hypothetical protein